jgi:hypothetical protein
MLMQIGNSSGLPPCHLSKHCLRLLDTLDELHQLPRHSVNYLLEHSEDEQLLTQLDLHIPQCPTCTTILTMARQQRNRQRSSIQMVLAESEQSVPSTTARIMSTIQSEALLLTRQAPLSNGHIEQVPGFSRLGNPQLRRKSSFQQGKFWRNIGALLAAAALILMTIGAFSQLPHRYASPAASNSYRQYTGDWGAVIIGQVGEHGYTSIMNYDPDTGKSALLVPPRHVVQIDGVSHDGHNVLYHFAEHGHTYFSTLTPFSHAGYFYALSDDSVGKALWETDSRHVFIASDHHGIIEVDTQTGTTQTILASLNVGRLWFYRDGYLYFDAMKHKVSYDLWRVNVVTAAVQRVTKTFRGRSYLLSPDGTTIFYADKLSGNALGATAIYTINVNAGGASSHLLLRIDAVPVGFAADNTLELLGRMNGAFQLIKLKPTEPNVDRVVLYDVAPGANVLCENPALTTAPVCDENAALSPYGHGLVVEALYNDGSTKIWGDNLSTGKRIILQTVHGPVSTPHMQLPGWDRIQVPKPVQST